MFRLLTWDSNPPSGFNTGMHQYTWPLTLEADKRIISTLMERIAGFEPTLSAWKAGMLPLNIIYALPRAVPLRTAPGLSNFYRASLLFNDTRSAWLHRESNSVISGFNRVHIRTCSTAIAVNLKGVLTARFPLDQRNAN